jgi:hypothetical protein
LSKVVGGYLDQLGFIAPEIVLTVVALAALVWDLLKKGRDSKQVGWHGDCL